MSSLNEDLQKKPTKSKKDPSRFQPPGLYYKGKFIGIEHVADACGDRSDMMCQVAMAKMKAAIKTLGDHKKRVLLNVSVDGIKILDERSEDIIFDHCLARISYISKDISDSRAFGYVFNPDEDCHEFYGIKTEKAAEVIVSNLRDLFYFICTSEGSPQLELNHSSLSENVQQEDESSQIKLPSPAYSLKYAGDGTLTRLKKSPHLFYRFYNASSDRLPVACSNSPRKQVGFLTLYSRQSSIPVRHSSSTTSPSAISNTSPIYSSSSQHVQPSLPVAIKTPSLSSSSSLNQNVNSPSTSALKSPFAIINSKKSLAVIESPPNSPTVFKLTTSFPTSPKIKVNTPPGEMEMVEKSVIETKTITLEGIRVRKQSGSVETLPDSTEYATRTGNMEASISNGTDSNINQMSWANFDEGFNEFEMSDDSSRDYPEESKFVETDSACIDQPVSQPEEEEKRKSFQSSKFFRESVEKNIHLVLSFNGIDPFLEDPFFNRSIDFASDDFKTDDFPQLGFVLQKQDGQTTWVDCEDIEEKFESLKPEETSGDFSAFCSTNECQESNLFPGQVISTSFDENIDAKLFEDDFVVSTTKRRYDFIQSQPSFPNVEDQFLEESVEKIKEVETEYNTMQDPAEVTPSTPESTPFLPAVSLKLFAKLKANFQSDTSLTSPSTNPSEFPSPDIPPPPLPPEITPQSPIFAPPLPPRRPLRRVQSIELQGANPETNINSSLPLDSSTLDGLEIEKSPSSMDCNKHQKLDTASILKLYSMPTTSYLSSIWFNSTSKTPDPAVASTFDSEPVYGNLHSVSTDDKIYVPSPTMGNKFSFQKGSSSEILPNKQAMLAIKMAPAVPPRIPTSKQSHSPFHSYSSVDHPSSNSHKDVQSYGDSFSQSLDMSEFLQRPYSSRSNSHKTPEILVDQQFDDFKLMQQAQHLQFP